MIVTLFEVGMKVALESEIINMIAQCGEDKSVVRKIFLEMLLDSRFGGQINYDQVSFLHENNILANFKDLYSLLTDDNFVKHKFLKSDTQMVCQIIEE